MSFPLAVGFLLPSFFWLLLPLLLVLLLCRRTVFSLSLSLPAVRLLSTRPENGIRKVRSGKKIYCQPEKERKGNPTHTHTKKTEIEIEKQKKKLGDGCASLAAR